MAILSPEWTVVEWAGGCTSCGSPTPCPKWLVGGIETCALYPCLCGQTRQQAYEDHGIEDAACWWRDKKRAGRLASRCPCWGRTRDDRLPQNCCSRHEANPAYVVEHLEAGIRGPVAPGFPTGSADASEAPARETSARSAGNGATGQDTGYTRLWPPDQSTCPCPTPWDNQKTVGGYHCPNCHANFANVATAMAHQPTVLHPCKPPESIVDCDTGRPLLYARDVRGAIVWAFAW